MVQILRNNCTGVLASPISADEKTLVLVDASKWPVIPAGDFLLATLVGLNENGQEAFWEIVNIGARVGNTLTVNNRGVEGMGTPPRAWPAGTVVQMRATAATIVTPTQLANTLAGLGLDAEVRKNGVYNLNIAPLGKFISVNGSVGEGATCNWPPSSGFPSATPAWFNVLTVGTSTRKTQFAWQLLPIVSTRNVWVRSLVETIWQPWVPLLTLGDKSEAMSRANHTGTQAISTISGLETALGYLELGQSNQQSAISSLGSELASTKSNLEIELARSNSNLDAAVLKLANVPDNAIRNPNMDISWRGTSFPIGGYAVPGEVQTLDGWRISKQSMSTGAVAQVAGLATWRSPNCLQYTISTARPNLGADEYEMIEQPIEGIRIHGLIGEACTFSALLYSSKVGIYTIRIFNPTAGYYFHHEVQVTEPNAFTRVTFPIPMGLANTLSWAVGAITAGVRVAVVLAAGANRRSATLDTWAAGSAVYASPNQVNFADTAGNVFRMTDVNFFPGTNSVSLPRRDNQKELDICYRYLPVVDPNSALNYGSPVVVGQAYAPTAAILPVPFRVPSRVPPTGILAYALTNYWGTTADFTVIPASSLSLYTYISNTVGTLLMQIGSSSFTPGHAVTMMAKAKIFYQGCDL